LNGHVTWSNVNHGKNGVLTDNARLLVGPVSTLVPDRVSRTNIKWSLNRPLVVLDHVSTPSSARTSDVLLGRRGHFGPLVRPLVVWAVVHEVAGVNLAVSVRVMLKSLSDVAPVAGNSGAFGQSVRPLAKVAPSPVLEIAITSPRWVSSVWATMLKRLPVPRDTAKFGLTGRLGLSALDRWAKFAEAE